MTKGLYHSGNRPKLKTRKFSTLHIEIFEQVLYSGKTNRDLNVAFGYTRKSLSVVAHSRKVMYKLLMLEGLKKEEYRKQVIYPRTYHLLWKRLLAKHKSRLSEQAVAPSFYDEITMQQRMAKLTLKTKWNNYYLT